MKEDHVAHSVNLLRACAGRLRSELCCAGLGQERDVRIMIGRIAAAQGRAKRIKILKEHILEMPVLLVQVPVPWRLRRVRRAARLLRRQGIARVLLPEDFPYRDQLEEWGIYPVETGEFCRRLAAPICLAALKQVDILPVDATVVLRGERVTRAMRMSALALCPQIKNLLIAAPTGGGGLQKELRREYGVPVLEDGGARTPDVAVHFAPAAGEGKVVVDLSGPFPSVETFTFTLKSADLPEDCARLPLMAVLYETGRLDPGDIAVFGTVHS